MKKKLINKRPIHSKKKASKKTKPIKQIKQSKSRQKINSFRVPPASKEIKQGSQSPQMDFPSLFNSSSFPNFLSHPVLISGVMNAFKNLSTFPEFRSIFNKLPQLTHNPPVSKNFSVDDKSVSEKTFYESLLKLLKEKREAIEEQEKKLENKIRELR